MRVLAIDSALGAAAAALYESISGEVLAQETRPMQRGQAEALMPLVERVVARVEGGFAAIDRYAVTIGPGSFTGLRIGIAAARAMALAHGKPVVGVSTLAAYAAPILGSAAPVPVATLIDARNGRVFFQLIGIDARALAGPGLFAMDEALRKMGGGPLALTGNLETPPALPMRDLGIYLAPAPAIAWVAQLGAAADPTYAPAYPLYLSEPEAVPPSAGRALLA
jgi:tRNA threonylcarbamoyladenosine biosynthesis protein TsaB